MRVFIPAIALFLFVLLTGCATTTEPVSTKSACAGCTTEGKAACATCASGEACAECAAKKSEAAERAGEVTPAVSDEPATNSEPVATIDAKGMSCPLCASNIDRRMQKLGGVNWTKIDLGTGQVMVGLDPSQPAPSADELQQAVNDAGYTAGDVTLPDSRGVTP